MKKWTLFGLVLLILMSAACNPPDDDEASPPTVITLLPAILTPSPLFTATLTPSHTPTASDTPLPTDTPTPITPTSTPSLTPTPPVIGVIISSQNVNIRAEDNFRSEALTSVEPGTQVEVQYSNEDASFIFVRLIDEEGQLIEGWVDARLLNIGTFVPPTIGPSPTPTPTQGAQPTGAAGFATATPFISGAAVLAEEAAEVSDVNILAYCRQKNVPAPTVTTEQTVSVMWSWFVKEQSLMNQHLQNANYEVLLDGRLLENYDDYRTAMTDKPIDDPATGDWYIYWFVPVGKLPAGRHEITFRLTWDEKISDGYAEFGPGTATETDEGNCVFTVVEG